MPLLSLGIIGALCAAVAGLTDWQDTDPPARRIGLIHGLVNIAGVGLFAGSAIARKRKLRGLGRCLAALGYAVASTTARLGGNMVFEHRVGVDHTAGQTFPDHFVPVLAEPELRDGTLWRVEYQGAPVLLARRGDRLFALAEKCSHWGGPLSEGKIIHDSVRCPWHGSRFALEDGGACSMDPLSTHSRAFGCEFAMARSKSATWYRRPGFHLSQAQQKRVLRLDRCDLFSSAFGPAGAGGLLTSVARANGQMRLMEVFEK